MEKNNEKVDFDLSTLNLQDLIKVYTEIDDFLKFLSESKIEEETEEDENE